MTEPFTASNGITIEHRGVDAGFHVWDIGSNDGCLFTAEEWEALAEFFRGETDRRLGRWRWGLFPNFLVYPDPDYPGDVLVIDEAVPDEPRRYARDSVSFEGVFGGAAEAFFSAHPEPKLEWHDAKPGEVWVLTIDGVESAFYPSKSLDRCFTPVAPNTGTTAVPFDWPEITTGHRIYPEVS